MSNRDSQLAMSFTVMQYANPEFWDDDYYDALEKEDTKLIGEVILRRLTSDGIPVDSFYIICHDKKIPLDDSELVEYDESNRHYHMLVKLRDTRRTLGVLAKSIGLDSNRLEVLRKGRYSYSNMLAYLIHYKDPDKYLYDPEEVVTICGRDYMEIFSERRVEWKRGRKAKQKKLSKISSIEESGVVSSSANPRKFMRSKVIDPVLEKKYSNYNIYDLLDDINKGLITQEDIYIYPRLNTLDILYHHAVDEAFHREERIYVDEVRSKIFQNDDYGFFQLYLYGPSRTGKSTAVKIFSDRLADVTREKFHVPWRTFYSSVHGDILSGYDGEELTVMNEFRSNSIRYEELLVIGDQQNQHVESRFHNKWYCSRANIVVTNQDIESFFRGLESSIAGKDPRSFYERMQLVAEIVERDIPYEELLTTRSVRLYTHSEYHKDSLGEIIKDIIPGSYFDASFNENRGIAEYNLNELISLNQLIDILLEILDRRMFNRMLDDMDGSKKIEPSASNKTDRRYIELGEVNLLDSSQARK